EVTGLENGETQVQELFHFKQTSVDNEGNAVGLHTATGNRSIHPDRFAERGETLSATVFEPSRLTGEARGWHDVDINSLVGHCGRPAPCWRCGDSGWRRSSC